jgi:hypothetical protein
MLQAASVASQSLEMQNDPTYSKFISELPKLSDSQQALSEYCDAVLVRFPFVTKATFRSFHARSLTRHNRSENGRPSAEDYECFVVPYLALATMDFAVHSSMPRQLRALQLHHHALQLMYRHMSPSRPIATLQCLIALVVCAYHHTAAGSLWHLVDITAGEVVALGLHHYIRADRGDDDIEADGVLRLLQVLTLINQFVLSYHL